MTSSTPKICPVHDISRLQLFAKLLACWCLLVGALHGSAIAAPVHPSSTSGSTVSYGAGTYSNATAAAAAVVTTAAGAVAVEYSSKIKTAAGAAIPVVTRALPSAAALAATFRACLGNPLCVGTAGAAAAAAAIASHYGYGVNIGPDGVPVVTRTLSGQCYVANSTGLPCAPTKLEAARQACQYFGFSGGSIVVEWFGEAVRCDNGYLRGLDTATMAPTVVPSSPGEIADAIAAAPNAGLPPAAADGWKKILPAAVGSGASVPLPAPYSIGIDRPTVYDVPTVITSAPDAAGVRTRTTTTTSTTATANPPSVSLTSGTVTDVQQVAPDGTVSAPVTTTTTGGTSIAPAEQAEPCTGADASTVGCAAMDTPSGEIPKSKKTIPFNVENAGLGSGQCPAPIQMQTSKGNYQIDLAPYCSALTNYVKPVLLLIAAFAAFAICVPKGADI